MTRTAQKVTRESTKRKTVFTQNSDLVIPEGLQQELKEKGMKARWVRVKLDGKDDVKNIGRRKREGWEFMHPDEVPEEVLYGSEFEDVGRLKGIVVVGDLALAKHNLDYVESRKQYYAQKNHALDQAVKQEIARQKGNELTPSGS